MYGTTGKEKGIYRGEHTGQHHSNQIAVDFFFLRTINSFSVILQGAEHGSAMEQSWAEVVKERRGAWRRCMASPTTTGLSHRSATNFRQQKWPGQPLTGRDSKGHDLHNRGSFTPSLPFSLSPAAPLLSEMTRRGLQSGSARGFLFRTSGEPAPRWCLHGRCWRGAGLPAQAGRGVGSPSSRDLALQACEDAHEPLHSLQPPQRLHQEPRIP